MKKTKSIALFLCVVLVLCLMTACKKRTPQTAGGFTQVMEAAGFEIHDKSDTGEYSVATAVVFAVGDNYQIEYYGYKDSDTAQSAYQSNYRTFDEGNPSKTLSTTVNSNRYNYCAFTSGGKFYVMARLENTMVGCVADSQYKQEILTQIEALGYK